MEGGERGELGVVDMDGVRQGAWVDMIGWCGCFPVSEIMGMEYCLLLIMLGFAEEFWLLTCSWMKCHWRGRGASWAWEN